MELAEIGRGFFGSAKIGLGDNFEQRCTCAIEIDACLSREKIMDRLARIFLKVCAGNTDDSVGAIVHMQRYFSPTHNRGFELTDLVTLWQIGVEVIFSVEDGVQINFGVHGEPEFNRHDHRLLIENR